MAEKINYKEYLAQLGKVETNQIERIKKYLEEQIQQDDALKALYRPEKINDCYDFIMGAVKEMPRKGTCAFVDDGIIFKMARDYFIEILPKVADEPPEVKLSDEAPAESEEAMLNQEEGGNESVEEGAAETEQTVTESSPAENENAVKTDEYGFEVFGEEPEKEEGAETAAEAETEAETEPQTESEIIEENSVEADNENSGTPCEDAEPENEKPLTATRYDEEGQGLFDF